MSKNNKIPKYLIKILQEIPNLKSGRKKYREKNLKIFKIEELIKKYFEKN